ncbi:helix-turn-helix domain-containing protein [Symbiopectobacterium purcellii]
MMTLETRVEIHVLHRQGMSIRAIARQLSGFVE